MKEKEPGEFERRLAALEQENRRLRRAILLGLPILGLAITTVLLGPGSLSCSAPRKPQEGAAAPAGDVLRVRRLEILNQQGNAVIVASADSHGWGRFVTYREDGQLQLVQASGTEDGGTIAVAGSAGRLRAAMAVGNQDDGTVFTFDRNNTRLIALSHSALGDGAVMSYDRVGNVKKMWP